MTLYFFFHTYDCLPNMTSNGLDAASGGETKIKWQKLTPGVLVAVAYVRQKEGETASDTVSD